MFVSKNFATVLAAASLIIPATANPTEVVYGFRPRPTDPADFESEWYDWYTTGAGEASTVNLADTVGDLKDNVPLGEGAGLLTTGCDNNDRTNVAIPLGVRVGDVFPSLNLGYWFYKSDANPSGCGSPSAAATAALKLEIYNPNCPAGNDCYAVLVYEYYVQAGNGNPTPNEWTQVSITPTSGGFWTSGGFGFGNGAGGPPYKTLSEWLNESTSPDFEDAIIVSVQIGVGSYNQGEEDYFDAVAISYNGFDATYDFETACGSGEELFCMKRGNSGNISPPECQDPNNLEPPFKNKDMCPKVLPNLRVNENAACLLKGLDCV